MSVALSSRAFIAARASPHHDMPPHLQATQPPAPLGHPPLVAGRAHTKLLSGRTTSPLNVHIVPPWKSTACLHARFKSDTDLRVVLHEARGRLICQGLRYELRGTARKSREERVRNKRLMSALAEMNSSRNKVSRDEPSTMALPRHERTTVSARHGPAPHAPAHRETPLRGAGAPARTDACRARGLRTASSPSARQPDADPFQVTRITSRGFAVAHPTTRDDGRRHRGASNTMGLIHDKNTETQPLANSRRARGTRAVVCSSAQPPDANKKKKNSHPTPTPQRAHADHLAATPQNSSRLATTDDTWAGSIFGRQHHKRLDYVLVDIQSHHRMRESCFNLHSLHSAPPPLGAHIFYRTPDGKKPNSHDAQHPNTSVGYHERNRQEWHDAIQQICDDSTPVTTLSDAARALQQLLPLGAAQPRWQRPQAVSPLEADLRWVLRHPALDRSGAPVDPHCTASHDAAIVRLVATWHRNVAPGAPSEQPVGRNGSGRSQGFPHGTAPSLPLGGNWSVIWPTRCSRARHVRLHHFLLARHVVEAHRSRGVAHRGGSQQEALEPQSV